MTWNVGVDLSHALLNALSYYSASGGNYSFRFVQTGNGASTGTGGIGFASFLLGVPNSVALASAALPYYYRWNSGAAFVQNDWKVRPNLTLNLGLRYTLQTPRTEKYNHQGTFLPNLAQSFPLATPLTLSTGKVITSALVPPFAFDGVAGRSPYLWPVAKTDFEPRFGFAWVPHPMGWNGEGRVAIRGGYGLSHVPFTEMNRLPNPNFGASSTTYNASSGAVNPAYATRLSSNPPLVNALSWNQVLNIPDNGLLYLPGLNYQGTGFILSDNVKTPYSQNWNLSINYKLGTKTVIEAAYVGNKGTHLFMPRQNANAPDVSLVDSLNASNVAPTSTIPDPLGRKSTAGSILNVQQGSLGSQYLGFNALYTQYNSSADSIRHATYISLVRRAGPGLTLTANYTFGKSIDDASDSSPDKGVLTAYVTGGEASFGGERRIDRSVSTFDIKHSFNLTFLYELPFGRRQRYLSTAPRLVRAVVGGWSVTGVVRFMSGTPFLPTLADSNLLGDTTQTHTMRPDISPGVPLINPLWQRACPVGNLCEPYLNPAAFERPAVGVLGNAPRTLDGVRGPLQRMFDTSIQKNFNISESGKRKIQLRVDALNVFNHPLLRNSNSTDIFGSQPSQSAITASQYDAWAAFNNQPLSTTPQGAASLAQIQGFITNNRLPSGALQPNFFTTPLPQGFALANPNSFDITTPNGFKLYRLKQAYTQTFGRLYAYPNPRYVHLGLKIFF